jgi:REP element-mobilizing transposase RayT
MPRRTTPFVPDTYYHFYNRGNNRQAIFFEPANYLYFLQGFRRYVFPQVSVIAYCLMPTHYHILVRVRALAGQTSEVSRQVSLAMQKFLISYTKAINKRFSRVGALFQGQFQAKPVESHAYLLTLCTYIHGNPVKDGLVAAPEDWPYSNYLEWMGERKGTLLEPGFISEHFGTPAEYRIQLMDYIRTRYLQDDMRELLNAFE